jgi:hypothetical protein
MSQLDTFYEMNPPTIFVSKDFDMSELLNCKPGGAFLIYEDRPPVILPPQDGLFGLVGGLISEEE